MSFPHQVGVIIPASIVDAGNRIARAMDEWGSVPPFDRNYNVDGNTYFLSWAGDSFTDWVKATRGSATKLRDDVNARISARGLKIELITEAEAQSFIDNAEIVVNAEVEAVRSKFRAIPDDS